MGKGIGCFDARDGKSVGKLFTNIFESRIEQGDMLFR